MRWQRAWLRRETKSDFRISRRRASHDALREFRRLEDTDGIADTLKDLTLLALAQGDRKEAALNGRLLLEIYQARGHYLISGVYDLRHLILNGRRHPLNPILRNKNVRDGVDLILRVYNPAVLYQVFHATLLIVSTRSPEKTEDIEFGVGMAIMAEGHRTFNHVAFVDAHNCFTGDISTVQPGTLAAYEYQAAALKAINEGPGLEKYPFRMGSAPSAQGCVDPMCWLA